jgi:flagellar hook assembly protein FlgD
VFDIAGRLVRTLDASDARGAATWDGKDGTGRNAAPGVYFVRVTSRDFTDARRVMLVR